MACSWRHWILTMAVLAALCLHVGNAAGRREMCPAGKWRCEDSSCVAVDKRCDGSNNCRDGSDEKNCEQWSCPSTQWKCANNERCVKTKDRCDGDDDCGDNSDELNCGELEIDCPTYVMEKSSVTCKCRARDVAEPYRITWPGRSNGKKLTLTNVRRSDNGTQFTCRLDGGPVVQEKVYTLLVAYGPHEGGVSISPSHLIRNGTNPVTVTCNANDTYPTPHYQWGGVPCLNRWPANTCTFLPDPTFDDNNIVTCRVESVTASDDALTIHPDAPVTASGSMGLNITYTGCEYSLLANDTYQSFRYPVLEDSRRYLRAGNNQYCVWHISAPSDKKLWINLGHVNFDKRGKCRDYLELYDAPTGKSIAWFCGYHANWGPISLPSNNIDAVFRSDYEVGSSGFRLEYQTVPECDVNHTATSSLQTLTTPGYPSNYLNSLECTWRITAPPGKFIWFNFTDFDLQKSWRGCRKDSVRINDASGRTVFAYCGKGFHEHQRSPFSSYTNAVTVIFRSDNGHTRRGFQLQYRTIDEFTCPERTPIQCAGDTPRCLGLEKRCDGRDDCGDNSDEADCEQWTCPARAVRCGSSSSKCTWKRNICNGENDCGDLSDEINCDCGGQLSAGSAAETLSFPSSYYYLVNKNCVWTITAPAGHSVQANIATIDMQSSSSCAADSLSLLDGGFNSTQSLGKYCGRQGNASPISSTGTSLTVRFLSNGDYRRGRGFSLQYQAVANDSD